MYTEHLDPYIMGGRGLPSTWRLNPSTRSLDDQTDPSAYKETVSKEVLG